MYFEIARKHALNRMRRGFRIKYKTLKKYKLIDEYKIWTQYAISKSNKKDAAVFKERLNMLKDEITFEKRLL